MNISLPFNIDAEVHVEICQEEVDKHMPLLDLCILKHSDPIIKDSLVKIKNSLSEYVAKGDAEMISFACSFIVETYESLQMGIKMLDMPAEIKSVVAELTATVANVTQKYKEDPVMTQRIRDIIKPLTVRLVSLEDFADQVKAITARLNNV